MQNDCSQNTNKNLEDHQDFQEFLDYIDKQVITEKFEDENQSANQNGKDIIVVCNVKELAQNFVQDYFIVWYHPQIHSQANSNNLEALRKDYDVKAFDDWKKACEFIKGTKTFCYLITSDLNGEKLVKEVANESSVPSVYVFVTDNMNDECLWKDNYPKVFCVEKDFQILLSKIDDSLVKSYREVSYQRHDLPSFAPIFDDDDTTTLNYLHLYLKGHVSFEERDRAKKDFLNISKMRVTDKKNIIEFQDTYNDYDMKSILGWYTRQSFLYKTTNNCLRVATYDSILYSRLILRDVEEAIKEQYHKKSKNYNGLLYRGTYLSDQEWINLQSNIGKDIEMHGFLSTSKRQSIGMKFLGSDTNQKALITVIVLPQSDKEEQGFAELKEFSRYPKEDEVLFNIRSRFTVLETRTENDKGLEYRHLVLLYGGWSWKIQSSEKKPNYEMILSTNLMCSTCGSSIGNVNNEELYISFGDNIQNHYYCKDCFKTTSDKFPLVYIPRFEKLKKEDESEVKIQIKGTILKYQDDDIPFYGYKCSICQKSDFKVYYRCIDESHEHKDECKWCENCISGAECKKGNHKIIVENKLFIFWDVELTNYQQEHLNFWKENPEKVDFNKTQIDILRKSKNYKKALHYLKIKINKKEIKELEEIAFIGKIYLDLGESEKAKSVFERSLKISQSINGEDHTFTADSYDCLGKVYAQLGEGNKAIENHKKSLGIALKICGEFDISVATQYNNIGMVHSQLGNHRKAIKYYEKSLKVKKNIYVNELHPYIASSCNNLGSEYLRSGDKQKAMEYYQRSLKICLFIYGQNHPHTAGSYLNLGNLNLSLGNFKEAIDLNEKSLEITRSIYGENHSLAADGYNNLGDVYINLGKLEIAKKLLQTSLQIRQRIYGECHHKTAESYENFGTLFSKLGHNEKALEYYKKSEEIRLKVFEKDRPEIANLYSNFGEAYAKLGEYEIAKRYLENSLKIRRKYYKKDHLKISDSCRSLGNLYLKLNQHTKALEYNLESLKIEQIINGEHHPDTASLYMNCGIAYAELDNRRKASEYFKTSLKIMLAYFGENHPEIATLYYNLGILHSKENNTSEALKDLEKSLEIRKKIYENDHPDIANSYNELGLEYQKLNKNAEAKKFFKDSLEIRKKFYEDSHPDIVDSYSNLGRVYLQLWKNEKAKKIFERLIDIMHSNYSENHPILPDLYLKLSQVYFRLGQELESVKLVDKSFALVQKIIFTPKDISSFFEHIKNHV